MSFGRWLLSLNVRSSRFIGAVVSQNVFLSEAARYSTAWLSHIFSFLCRWTPGPLPPFGHCKQGFCEHGCASLRSSPCVQFLGVDPQRWGWADSLSHSRRDHRTQLVIIWNEVTFQVLSQIPATFLGLRSHTHVGAPGSDSVGGGHFRHRGRLPQPRSRVLWEPAQAQAGREPDSPHLPRWP